MEQWMPELVRDQGNSAGQYTDSGEPKGLLHTTEGKTYASARAAYVKNNSWPHATLTFEGGVFKGFQHNPIGVAARSLRNLPGGIQTNTDRVFQIELVGTSDRRNAASWGQQYVENFPQAYLDGIRRVMRWAEAQLGIPRICSVTFKAYPESYGNNGVRLSNAAFDAYSGWLGHQHAAENDHGDPGLINMAYLLSDLTAPEEPEEEMLSGTFIICPESTDPTRVWFAGLGFTPRPVTRFVDVEFHAGREDINVLEPAPGSGRVVTDIAGATRTVMVVGAGHEIFGIDLPNTTINIDVKALAQALAPLITAGATAETVAAAVKAALQPDFDSLKTIRS